MKFLLHSYLPLKLVSFVFLFALHKHNSTEYSCSIRLCNFVIIVLEMVEAEE